MRLYGVAEDTSLFDRAEIHQGRLLISNDIEILPYPSEGLGKDRQKWAKKYRSIVAIIAKEIEQLDKLVCLANSIQFCRVNTTRC